MGQIVLFVSPYVQDVCALAQMLNPASIAVEHAKNLKEAAAWMAKRWFPAVLTEARLDDGSWRDVLGLARRHQSELVVTDAFADVRFWAETINLGAFDMLAQPFHATEVCRVLASAACRNSVNVATA